MSMQSILSASASMSRIQKMQSVRSKTQGQIDVLNAEIKQDGGDSKKEEQVNALEEQSANLTGNLMGELSGVNETLKTEKEPTKPEEDTSKGDKVPDTDQVELSKPSDATIESKAIRSNAPAIYDAAGEVKEAVLSPEKRLDIKA